MYKEKRSQSSTAIITCWRVGVWGKPLSLVMNFWAITGFCPPCNGAIKYEKGRQAGRQRRQEQGGGGGGCGGSREASTGSNPSSCHDFDVNLTLQSRPICLRYVV